MRIVWDQPKRIVNLEEHGLDFGDIVPGFFATALVLPTHTARFQAIGYMPDGKLVSVVFKRLGTEGVSIISMRPAGRKERRLI